MRDALVLVDLAGAAKAFLEPRELSFTRRWCGPASIAGTVDVQDPKAAELVVASRALQLWLDGAIRFHGKVGEPLSSNVTETSFVASDPLEELAARKLAAAETYTAEDAGAIAWASIDTENTRNTTRIREGAIEASVARTITFPAGTSRADVLTQLSQLDGGFGFTLEAVGDDPGVLAELVVRAQMVHDLKPGVRFEYGSGTRANCGDFTEELRRPRNRIIVTGTSQPDGTRPQATAEDTASQAEYGIWEYELSLESADTTVLQAHANAELRPDPIAVYTLEPTPDAPLLFQDFDVGDVVDITIRRGRVDVAGTARVDEATMKRTPSGAWLLDTLTLTPSGVQRVTRSPDERLYALLGAYRDRIAVLERARLVGA